MIKKNCVVCGVEFIDNTHNHHKIYCDLKCLQKEKQRRAKKSSESAWANVKRVLAE